MGLIIRPGETTPEQVSPENGKNYKLARLQGIVGGLIEILRLDGGRIMVINEEGKLYNLEYNFEATKIAYQSDALIPGDWIVGTVLVCNDEEVQ